ncbi:Hypothetical protein SMAX5B_015085 [Scophthalmus maximus]|uniref:Uncharacterized protein n=1 Tax=Scophthalmus maximus TaxID=52904 RepID=A0A2U9CF07_SCOMX|nr:Hypothetical protein SMAX5B_015085 [Scophthalmus maximus]
MTKDLSVSTEAQTTGDIQSRYAGHVATPAVLRVSPWEVVNADPVSHHLNGPHAVPWNLASPPARTLPSHLAVPPWLHELFAELGQIKADMNDGLDKIFFDDGRRTVNEALDRPLREGKLTRNSTWRSCCRTRDPHRNRHSGEFPSGYICSLFSIAIGATS